VTMFGGLYYSYIPALGIYIYKYHFLGSSVFRRPLFHVVLPAVSTLLEVSISPK
jgi:hypothetical protein